MKHTGVGVSGSNKVICVLGLGYIGLPTATLFASRGVSVTGIDINPVVVNTINRGEIHIEEPGLDSLLRGVVHGGTLTAAHEPPPADAFFIAVPTPFSDGYVPDLSYVEAAGRAIAPVLKKGDVVILESTSSVGTTERLAAQLGQLRRDLAFPLQSSSPDVHVAYCPERVLPGNVITELVENDRVIGGLTPACAAAAVEIYRLLVTGELITTDARTAELCKLTENAFRDVNIAFANELSVISRRLGINVWELIRLANHHPRVNILTPSVGVGGHCIAVDPWFIVDSAPEDATLIRTAREVNDGKPRKVIEWIYQEVRDRLGAAGTKKTLAIYGLAFKPNIDDLRESPALHVARELVAAWPGEIVVVEPHISNLPPGLERARLVDVSDASRSADIGVVLVKHRAFEEALSTIGTHSCVVDVVGILS